MFEQRKLMLRVNNQGVPRWEDAAVRGGLPLAKWVIGRALGISPGVEVGDEAVVWEEFDHVAALLADGRPFLTGERFTTADLTFAALAAPVIVPPRYGVRLPAARGARHRDGASSSGARAPIRRERSR